jgi:hypothetical protein
MTWNDLCLIRNQCRGGPRYLGYRSHPELSQTIDVRTGLADIDRHGVMVLCAAPRLVQNAWHTLVARHSTRQP